MGNMCLPARNNDDTPFEMLEQIRESQIESGERRDTRNYNSERILAGSTERFGSIVEGHAARTPSIIDTKYKSLADTKERLRIDVINSKNQYQGEKGKEIQKYLTAKAKKKFIPLRKTGFDMAGDDTVFELCIILDSTGSMGP